MHILRLLYLRPNETLCCAVLCLLDGYQWHIKLESLHNLFINTSTTVLVGFLSEHPGSRLIVTPRSEFHCVFTIPTMEEL